MSTAATTWARKQRTGDARTSYVLRDLADRANAKGECWPTTKTIADDTEQSISSVKRCLANLEQQHLIARIEQAQHSDSGKWSAALTIVLFNDAAKKSAVRHGWSGRQPQSGDNRDVIIDGQDAGCSYGYVDRSSIGTTARGPDWTTDVDSPRGPDWTTDRGSLLSHKNRNLRTYPPKVPPASPATVLEAGRGLSERGDGNAVPSFRPKPVFVEVDSRAWDAWCAFEGGARDTFRRQIRGSWVSGAFFPERWPPAQGG